MIKVTSEYYILYVLHENISIATQKVIKYELYIQVM